MGHPLLCENGCVTRVAAVVVALGLLEQLELLLVVAGIDGLLAVLSMLSFAFLWENSDGMLYYPGRCLPCRCGWGDKCALLVGVFLLRELLLKTL